MTTAARTGGEALLAARGLTKRYRSGGGDLTVFEGLNLEIYSGDFVALTGESGTGKSTLLHLLGLLDEPSCGEILLEGRSVPVRDEAATAAIRNRALGFVWQINTLLPEFTALENIMMPLLIGGATRKEAEGPARARLLEVGLENRASHRAGELSGGEQQRVALARALVSSPRLLLADEPTGSLDEKTGEKIMDLLCGLHRIHGLTTLFVTHHPGFARRGSRRWRLRGGALEESGG